MGLRRAGAGGWWLGHGDYFSSSIFQILLFYSFYKNQISRQNRNKNSGRKWRDPAAASAEPAGPPTHTGWGQPPLSVRAPLWAALCLCLVSGVVLFYRWRT